MLTIYSTLKNFTNEHLRIIQTNAVNSWKRLDPTPEIFIMGGDETVVEFCKEMELTHVKVRQSEYGTPYLRDMMQQAEDLATNNYILLVSGDIILFHEVMTAINVVANRISNFCICAIKQESNIVSLIDYNSDWEETVRKSLIHYSLPTSGDFFLYPKKRFLGSIPEIPDFIIGRSSCDSWLIKKAQEEDILVNATDLLTLAHQQHDHSHITLVDGGSPEYQSNFELAENSINTRIDDSNWIIQRPYPFFLIKKVDNPCPLNNIYHICGPKTASQWFKAFYGAISEYTGMNLYDLEVMRYGWDYRTFTDRYETNSVDDKTLACPLYMSYDNFQQLPKVSNNYKSICVIRDPRDQLISFYKSVRYSHGQIGFHPQWRARLEACETEKDGIIEALKIMKEFGILDAMNSYKNFYDDSKCLVMKYRELFGNDQFSYFRHLVDWLEIPISHPDLGQILKSKSDKNLSQGRNPGQEDKFSHYRKGVADDWMNYFDDEMSQKFHEIAGNIITNLRFDL